MLSAMILVMGSRGLQTAVANGDTRTITLHHIHTNEDITITYKRDGRYDEEALKKLDWFVRDWRREESIHMDPRLYDLVWEVSREVAGDRSIHVVCGYRSPATNAMLRRRSNGVAQFSQHTLGKAMDLFVPGASLEEMRYSGLRMQRGGVGYYPTSGSPFVHLDVGPVRYWPRMSHDQLARVFPNGRTVHVPSDGHPLAGYAQALAEVQKRGASVPSQASVDSAEPAGTSAPRKKSLLAALFNKDDDDESGDVAAATPAPAAAPAPRRNTYSLASVDSKAVELKPARAAAAAATPAPTTPVATARKGSAAAPTAAAAPVTPPPAAGDNGAAITPTTTASLGREDWTFAGAAEPPRPPAPIKGNTVPPLALSANSEVTVGTVQWPVRTADNDHVPLDMVLAYSAQPGSERDLAPVIRTEPMGETPARAIAAAPAKTATLRDNVTRDNVTRDNIARDNVTRDNVTAVAKKNYVRPATVEPVVHAKPVAVIANAGMRYDDPWLRAMIVAPSLSSSMSSTVYGDPDISELRTLMNKPPSTVMMSFNEDPYPGITADRFSGEAIVFLTTYAFQRRTASLR